jgi:hypothetical protein
MVTVMMLKTSADKGQQQFTGVNWLVANKNFVMDPVGCRNQEQLCCRGPAEIYWTGEVSSQPPVREQGPLRKEEVERIPIGLSRYRATSASRHSRQKDLECAVVICRKFRIVERFRHNGYA